MADEAFALSPVSVQSVSSAAAEYDAIRDAFLETARGRWFLGEYAKRNRNSDTALVLEAVARIEHSIAASRTPPEVETPALEADKRLATVKTILDQCRAAIAASLAEPASNQTLTPFRRSARILQEIAWGLRESGADGRICNLLDGQVRAINTACEDFAASRPQDAAMAAIEAAISQIELLINGNTPPVPETDETISAAPDEGVASGDDDLMPPQDFSPQEGAQGEDEASAAAIGTAETATLEIGSCEIDGLDIELLDAAPSSDASDMLVADQSELESQPEDQPAPLSEPPVAEQSVMPVADSHQASLGASLIAHGIIAPAARARPDLLAPIQRMSHAEKIAFFS